MAFARLEKAGLTQDMHDSREVIISRANNILRLYRHDQLVIDSADYPTLAEYINKFGFQHKEEMLDKLQSGVNFDVSTYLEDKSKSLWQRLFPKKSAPILTASKMISEIKKYDLVSRRVSHKSTYYANHADFAQNFTQKLEILQRDSEERLQAFLEGKLVVELQDLDVFKQYINTFNASISEDSLAARALERIEKLQQNQPSVQKIQPRPTRLRKPVISSIGFKRKNENFFVKATKSLSTLWNNTKKKQADIHLSSIKKERFWQRAKVAAVTALVVIGSAFTLKLGVSQQKGDALKTDKTSTVQKTDLKVKTATALAASEFSNIQKSQATSAAKSTATKTEDKHAKIWKNYYDTTIDIVAPTVHVNKGELYAQIDSQVDKGILTLPEGISKEKVALNYVLFKAYGLQSSLDAALYANEKLSDKQQGDFVRDAGIKQTDIKKIALKKHGKLSSYSAYNRSSKTQKTRYAKNLQQLRQMTR